MSSFQSCCRFSSHSLNYPISLPIKFSFFPGIHIDKHSTALEELTQTIAPHFLDDCRLSMYNLIIGKWQQVQFIVKIIHGEPKVSVMGRPLKRGHPEIIQRIVHPTHIPFIIKPQSSVFNKGSRRTFQTPL